MKMLAFGAMASMLFVTACDTPLPVERDPVPAKVSAPAERLTGNNQEVVVRSFTTVDEKRVEIPDANCTIRSDELSAQVTTPQAIIVPTFKQRKEFPKRGLPSALVADCRKGPLQGRAQVTSQPKQITTATGGGLAAALVVTAISAAVATSSPWVYPPAMGVSVE